MSASETGPTNADIVASVEKLRADLNGRLTRLETWRAEHHDEAESYKATVDTRLVALDTRIERQHIEVLRQVSATMQEMVRDAMQSGMQELFVDLFRQMQESEREERRKELRQTFGHMRRSVVWVQPFIGLVLGLIAIYGAFFR